MKACGPSRPRARRGIASTALSELLRELGIPAVPHGFRSSFRDWVAEETDHPREVVEPALAHVVQNRVEAAYRRTDLFERRRVLMDDWAAYLDRLRAGGEIEPGTHRNEAFHIPTTPGIRNTNSRLDVSDSRSRALPRSVLSVSP